jgi:hypothetical protein
VAFAVLSTRLQHISETAHQYAGLRRILELYAKTIIDRDIVLYATL